jgi:DNA invertase Pin-like site-specific DNA recombinase
MATTPDTEITWGAYLRLSRKKPNRRKAGRQLGRYRNPDESVERQLHLIRAYADEHGLNLPDHLIFRDNGRSGWREPGGPPPHRPDWDRMIAAGRAGQFGGLLAWKIDRFTRNTDDGQDLVHLRVLIDGPDTGRIDPRTATGLSNFTKQVEAAQHSSHETSEKVRAAFTDMLASGYRIGGSGRLFGFEILSQTEVDWDWNGDGGRFIGPAAVVREDEAQIIRELAGRLLAGETVQDMADDLNERGITTTRGGRWAPRNLSRTIGNPLYGGQLAYKGEILTTKAGDPVMLANVEPILGQGTYDAVQAKLGARKRGRRVTGRYPLSGVLTCASSSCSRRGTMAGYPRSGGKRAYICAPANGGCGQSVLADPVEAIVRNRVLADWADEAEREAMREADATLDGQREKLRGVLADLDADMAETEAKLETVPRSMTRRREAIGRNLASMTARYQATERELEGLGPVDAPAPELPDVVTAEEWDHDTPAAEKAAIIRRLGLRITITPSARKQGASRLPFDTGRVQITPGA